MHENELKISSRMLPFMWNLFTILFRLHNDYTASVRRSPASSRGVSTGGAIEDPCVRWRVMVKSLEWMCLRARILSV